MKNSVLIICISYLTILVSTWVPVLAEDTIQVQRFDNDEKLFELEFKNARLGDVIRVLAEQTGTNVIATRLATEKLVSIYLKDVNLKEAVESICRITGLWYRQSYESGTFRIMTIEEYSKDLVVHQDDEIRVFELLNPNVQIIAQTIEDIYGSRVILSLGLDPAQEQNFSTATGGGFGGGGFNRGGGSSSRGSSRAGIGGRRGGGRSGGTGGIGGSRGGSNLTSLSSEQLTNKAAEFEEDELTVDQIATITEQSGTNVVDTNLVSDITSRQSPIYVTANNEHNMIVVRTGDRKAMQEIAKLITKLDKPIPQVLLEMKVLDILIDDDFRSLFDVDLNIGQSTVPATAPATGTLPTNVFDIGGFASQGGTFVYQFFSNRLLATLELLEQNNRVNTLATPVILASNNRPAELFVGEETVLTTGVDTLINETNLGVSRTILQPQTEVREIGNRIFITPRINEDKTITLELQQETSSVNVDGGSVIVNDGAGNVQEVAIDTVNTSNILGTVVAQDGYTMAVGGLIRKTKAKNSSKVPILGDLPAVGWLFRQETQDDSHRELVLLITPHVLNKVEEVDRVSRERIIEPSRYSEWPIETVPPHRIKYKQDLPGYIEDDLNIPPTPGSEDVVQRNVGQAPSVAANPESVKIYNRNKYEIPVRSQDKYRQMIKDVDSGNPPADYVPMKVTSNYPTSLFKDRRLIARVSHAWKYEDIYITRVIIENISNRQVDISVNEMRGEWLSATFESLSLAPDNRTIGYLISTVDFIRSVATIPRSISQN